jgi:hypothetical protein
MPVKRTVAKPRVGRITPEALAAFKAGRDLARFSDEFNDYCWALHEALGLKPWQIPPLWVNADDRSEWDRRSQADMIELRQQLEAELRDWERG